MSINASGAQTCLQSAKIFIVDDALHNLDVLRAYLEKGGHEVAFANTGERALQLIPKWQPHLILLDILMSPMDGFTVCRHLKDNAATADIPVIFISALSSADDLARGFREGGVDYLTKPLSRQEVFVKVQTQLERLWYRQRAQRLQRDLLRCAAIWLGGAPTKAVLHLDEQGALHACNPKACHLLNLAERTLPLAADVWTALFEPVDWAAIRARCILSETPCQTCLYVQATSQSVQAHIFPMPGENPQGTEFMVVLD